MVSRTHPQGEAARAYTDAFAVAEDRKGWLFCVARGYDAIIPFDHPMTQARAWWMIRRRLGAPAVERRNSSLNLNDR